MSNKTPLICYLFTKYDKIRSLSAFVKNYKKYKAGYKHDLVICYKLFKIKEIQFLEKILNLKHFKFIDTHNENDWDFGSYGWLLKIFKQNYFFMNSHSYPLKIIGLKFL